MKPAARLTVRALQPIIAGLEALGHPVQRLLAAAGIAVGSPADPDAHLPAGSVGRLWDRAVAATGDECLGLHVALAAPVASFDLHAYAMLSSPTLRDAFHRACRYQRLLNAATELTFAEDGDTGVLRHARAGGGAVSRQPAEFLAATWLRFGRLVTGSLWTPLRVFFAHAKPADTRAHQEIFGVAPRFDSAQTALHIPAAVLALPNPKADPSLLALLDRYADTLLERQPTLTTVSARLRAWLVEAHGAGTPEASRAARALAMSVRTLHRHLKDEGTTFRTVLERFRHEKAVELLVSRRRTIPEIAFLLGYSELSAFYRAFRRWTGSSPAAFRDNPETRAAWPK